MDLSPESPATIRDDGIWILFAGTSGFDRLMSATMAGEEVRFGFTGGSDIVVRARPLRDGKPRARSARGSVWTPLPYELRRCFDEARGGRCPRLLEGVVYSSTRGLAVHISDQAFRDAMPVAHPLRIWRERPSAMRGRVMDTVTVRR